MARDTYEREYHDLVLNQYKKHECSITPEQISKVHTKFLMRLGPYKVWLCDFDYLRDYVFVDAVGDANPSRYTFVPMDEIWIEDNMGEQDTFAITRHAYVEAELMKNEGLSYDRAHHTASMAELKFRNEHRLGEKAK